jgi:hypothetical protein
LSLCKPRSQRSARFGLLRRPALSAISFVVLAES